ncbi:MAG: Gx transporter family protein [Eubacteriales bacterium]
MTVKKITTCGMLACLAMAISLLERYIPMDIMIPGLKLGLANIVTVYAILKIGKKEALMIFLTRVLLVAFLSGRVSALLFSILGGFFAWVIMCILAKFLNKGISIIGLSIAGAAFHNIGQIIAGIITIGTVSVLSYLSYLLILSIPVGFITGELLIIFLKKTKNLPQF